MKIRKTINVTTTVLAVAMIALSGIMKLSGSGEVITKLAAVGVGPYISILGVMELVFALLFVYPKTMKLGFVLISCYFAGAIATDLSHGMSVTNALIPLVLTWIAAFLRDRSVLIPVAKDKVNMA